ncbi:unnamed protein product [Ambrosiozyma monospora]|uniref:Unnamed protein product n=1 Tax=Ambrosiozyma monospora TaxID=43982 RepID=A0ACB5TZN2_AMBMO|nr:unnamed protein product [Ambrosiozyma monospora]
MKFVADRYPFHCSQESEWKLIPRSIENIELDMSKIKYPGLKPPNFVPFGMVFPDEVHPNLKVTVKIHFYTTVFITEQNILTFEEQLLLGIEKRWHMVLKNVPKNVEIIKHPEYRNIKIDFMPLYQIMRRNLKSVHREGPRERFGKLKIKELNRFNGRESIEMSKNRVREMRDEEHQQIWEKLNECGLSSVPDLVVYP